MQRRYRLTSNKSFVYLYRKGTCVRTPLLLLYYVPGRYDIKVGFSVSKKVGKSVVRNKVKRRLKENFRALIPSLAKGYTCLVTAKPAIADASFADIGAALRVALVKAGLLEKA